MIVVTNNQFHLKYLAPFDEAPFGDTLGRAMQIVSSNDENQILSDTSTIATNSQLLQSEGASGLENNAEANQIFMEENQAENVTAGDQIVTHQMVQIPPEIHNEKGVEIHKWTFAREFERMVEFENLNGDLEVKPMR